MKEAYIPAEMEIVVFEDVDVITTSNTLPFVPFNTGDESFSEEE